MKPVRVDGVQISISSRVNSSLKKMNMEWAQINWFILNAMVLNKYLRNRKYSI